MTANLARLSDRFSRFAEEARTYDGPLYAALSMQIAADIDVLAVATHVRRPPVPNVLFAAVHFLLADSPYHPLAAFYGSLSEQPRSPDEAYPAFRDFVLSNRSQLMPLLETRITQTNEVGRCSFLLPAFTTVHQLAGGPPLALIDVGCSAGLHLRWDRYHYDYGNVKAGDPQATVSIECELRGSIQPPVGGPFPECAFRIGIDLQPVDLNDPEERRWFFALIWPEHADRRRMARAAVDALLADPPHIVKGNAVTELGVQMRSVPAGTRLVVYNSAALCQGGSLEVDAVAKVLTDFSHQRPIGWLFCEGEEVLFRQLENGRMVETKLANKDGHGRWLEWIQPPTT
jgi:hypothetical protein